MCPYCGEEVPDDSTRCWKCGTEMSEGGGSRPAGDDDDLEVPPDDEDGGGRRGGELVGCPFCDSPMPRSAMRCKECGRTVRAPDAARGIVAWRLAPWLIFLAVAVGSAAIVGVVVLKRTAAKPVVKEWVPGSFKDADTKLGPLRKVPNEARRTEIWNDYFKNKYVRWDGYVLKVECPEGAGYVEIELVNDTFDPTKPLPKRPDVVVTFPIKETDPDPHTKRLKLKDKIQYTARLIEFGGRAAFTLDDGECEEK